jgi:pilus assembly protein CpaB
MNPRQRRAVLLLAIAAIGLVGVFVLVANYVSEVETQVGDKIVVLELTRPVAANEAVPDGAVRRRTIPRRWAPEAALSDFTQLVGLVAGSDLQPNSILQEGMLVSPPQLQEGQREEAILVDASTGVAGRVRPGDIVDVIASYAAEQGSETVPGKPNRTMVIVPGAEVINVGTPRLKGATGVQDAPAEPGEVVPVTFALDKRQSLKVAHASVFGADVRLALLRRGDPADRTLGETIFRGEDPKQQKDGTIR